MQVTLLSRMRNSSLCSQRERTHLVDEYAINGINKSSQNQGPNPKIHHIRKSLNSIYLNQRLGVDFSMALFDEFTDF